MPSAPQIRKLLLNALNETIIPLLQAQVVPQILASPEHGFPGGDTWPVQEQWLPDIIHPPLDVLVDWKEERLTRRRMALLGFSYSGASLEKVGVTRQMARDISARGRAVPAGITAVRVVSPSVFYVPAFTPHQGTALAGPQHGPSRILLAWLTPTECWLCHHDAVQGGTYALFIPDSQCLKLVQDYVRLLENREEWPAQLTLLDLMKRFASQLAGQAQEIGNGAFFSHAGFVPPHVSPRDAQYCYRLIDYVQFHLAQPLTLQTLAKVCGITPQHLSQLFRKATGMTVMNFVTQTRLRAAELMLTNTRENIGEIAKMSGFASLHSFDGVFRRAHGMSPSRYRRTKHAMQQAISVQ